MFTELPSPLLAAKGVEKLDISCNRLVALGPEIVAFTSLRVLRISMNFVPELPAELFALPALTELSAEHCEIASFNLPARVRVSPLEKLELDNNRLSSLPANIGLLAPTLISLSVVGNDLSELPSTISMLQNLGELWASNNRITKGSFPLLSLIPDTI